MKKGAAGLCGGENNLGAVVYHLRRCAEVCCGPTAEAEADEGSPGRSQENVWHKSLTLNGGLVRMLPVVSC